MRELIELQTGQVTLLSGLLSGFAMTAALHILRHGMRDRVTQVVFYISVLSSLLFLVALYVDIRLTLELAGKTEIVPAVLDRIVLIRFIGTTSATVAFSLFIVSLGMLGWLSSRFSGMVTSGMTIIVSGMLVFVWMQLNALNIALN